MLAVLPCCSHAAAFLFIATTRAASIDYTVYQTTGHVHNRVSLIDAISYHNELFKKKISLEKSQANYLKFEALKSNLLDFIKFSYRRNDLFLKELNHEFIVKIEFYLRTEDKIAHNTAMKYMQQLKKIVHLSVVHGWIIIHSTISSVPFCR